MLKVFAKVGKVGIVRQATKFCLSPKGGLKYLWFFLTYRKEHLTAYTEIFQSKVRFLEKNLMFLKDLRPYYPIWSKLQYGQNNDWASLPLTLFLVSSNTSILIGLYLVIKPDFQQPQSWSSFESDSTLHLAQVLLSFTLQLPYAQLPIIPLRFSALPQQIWEIWWTVPGEGRLWRGRDVISGCSGLLAMVSTVKIIETRAALCGSHFFSPSTIPLGTNTH